MGIFRKHDELFEIMSRRPTGSRNPSEVTGPHRAPINQAPASTTTSAKRRMSSSFGPRSAIGKDEPEFFEVDGDALIVVEDGWTIGAEEGDDGEPKTFAMRGDTLAVGACLLGGLVLAAFLFGRSSSEATPVAAVQIGGAPEAITAPAEPGAAQTPLPSLSTGSLQVGSPQTASYKPAQSAPSQKASASTPQATTIPASAPVKRTKPGKWTLLVCTTTPKNASRLSKWLNESGLSPIFGRKDLEAEASRRGVVKIRGFQERERDVESQVKATHDPLGSGTFHSAYFVKRP